MTAVSCLKTLVVPLAAAFLSGCLSAGAGPAAAEPTTHVVGPGERIQAAVKRASDGDTILVRDGTYAEQVTVCGKKNLRIVSETLHGARLQGDRTRPLGFRDCEFRIGTSTADGAPGTYIKGFWIGDGPGYGQGGPGKGTDSTLARADMAVIGAGRDWVIDSVRIERVANGIVLAGSGAMVVDTAIEGIERQNAHFLNAEVPGSTGPGNPRIRDLTVSRATFTGCNTRDLNGAPAWTNCTKILQADNIVIEHVRSENHVGSALWLDWRIRNYVVRFSRFADMRTPRLHEWMAALQIEGSQAENFGPVPGNVEDGQVCFNAFEDNAFADIHLAESSNLSIYRNRFGARSRVSLSVRDLGTSRHGAYPVSFVRLRDNDGANVPPSENQNAVITNGRRGNRLEGETGADRAADLARCAGHVRPAAYGEDCLGAFCGRPLEDARAAYDPGDFDPKTVDGRRVE